MKPYYKSESKKGFDLSLFIIKNYSKIKNLGLSFIKFGIKYYIYIKKSSFVKNKKYYKYTILITINS